VIVKACYLAELTVLYEEAPSEQQQQQQQQYSSNKNILLYVAELGRI